MTQSEGRPEINLQRETLDYSYRAVVWDIAIMVILIAVLILNPFEPVAWSSKKILLYLACLVGSLPVIISAVREALQRRLSMDLLSGLALVASILAGQLVSAIFIAMMLTASRMLGDWSDRLVRRGVRSLLRLRPHSVKVEIRDEIFEKPVHELRPGDIVIAESGKRIAVDGLVIDGAAAVDESSLTGESLPVRKEVNSRVFSSTLVAEGHLKIRAEKVGRDTTLEKIVKLVEGAQAQKSRMTTLAEKFGKIYIISVMLVSVVIYYFTHNFNLVLSVILVVCADDVAVAVPLAYLIAAGKASRVGIIIKGSTYLESMGRAKVFLFDKTGTLTKGVLKVDSFEVLDGIDRQNIISAVGDLASESSHPVSKAIHKFADKNGAKPIDVSDITETSGKGTRGVFEGKSIAIGNRAFLRDLEVKISEAVEKRVVEIEELGQSAVFFTYDGQLATLFAVSDEVKANAKESTERLRLAGVSTMIMITGDSERVALKIAKAAGLKDFRAKVSPEDKLAEVKKHLSKDYTTVMVGDGVNDAAALSLADVGIAMGHTGFDVAIESADIVLMHDDLSKLVETMELSRKVRSVIKQDFWIWGLSNALGLFLVFGSFIGPAGAAAYNFISDFFPLANSVRIFFSGKKPL